MKLFLGLLSGAILGLALGALMDLKDTNPAVGNTLIVLLFGSAIIAGVIHTERQK